MFFYFFFQKKYNIKKAKGYRNRHIYKRKKITKATKERSNRMSVYIIDYENVTIHGLEGINLLSSRDTLCIFYGPVPASLPFTTYLELANTEAEVRHIGTRKTAKNYLDFHIATYVGMLVGRGEEGPYRLITGDSGFDSIVDFLSTEGYVASRHTTIKNAVYNIMPTKNKSHAIEKGEETAEEKTEEANLQLQIPNRYKEKVSLALKTANLSKNQVKKITQIFAEADDRPELHKKITQYLRSNQKEDVTKESCFIYRKIKELYEDYRGLEHLETQLEKYEPISFSIFQMRAREGLKTLKVPLCQYHSIYNITRNAQSKSEFKNRLTEMFGEKTGETYYLILADEFMHYLAGCRVEGRVEKEQ